MKMSVPCVVFMYVLVVKGLYRGVKITYVSNAFITLVKQIISISIPFLIEFLFHLLNKTATYDGRPFKIG